VPYITSAKTDGIAHPQVALTSISIEHQKHKKLQKIWHIFRRWKMWCNHTTLATQFTTTTPQKHHTNHSLFSKTPANTTHHHTQKK
jgi:hypothetical protein